MKTSGFTLIESLVAITIIMLAITGPLYASSRELDAASLARNQLIASSLAQEAIEAARWYRDMAFLTYGYTGVDANWWADHFLGASGSYSLSQCVGLLCTYDPLQAVGSQFATCSGPCTPLNISASPVEYTEGAGTKTIFNRFTTLSAVAGSPTEELVRTVVTWQELGQTFSVILTDHLTPWQ